MHLAECKKCKQTRPIELFRRKHGRSIATRCADCRGVFGKYREDRRAKWQEKNKDRIELFIEAKNQPCMDCGNRYHPVAMDFDHVRGEKYKEITLMIAGGSSMERIKEEIAKCDIVCSNCHRIRTHNKREPGPCSMYKDFDLSKKNT